MRKTLTDKGVAALKPRQEMYRHADPEMRLHYVKVEASGVKTFWVVPRNPSGQQKWTKVGDADVISIAASRKRAGKIIERVRAGLPAEETAGDSFADISANWFKRHVEKKGLRTAPEIRRLLDKHILPAWGDRPFTSIRRSDVTGLLDDVEDNNGPRQADCVLDVLRAVMFWHSARHDDYIPPIVRGMRRQSTKAQARSRVLSDLELRKLWAKAEGTFGSIIKIALLSAQRRDKIINMKWNDIENGIWTVPTDMREKGNIGSVALPRMALDIINAQPRLASNGHVFSGRGSGPFNSFSKPKLRLDAQLKIPAWKFHDLRRTSRSLLSRCGVSSEHAERVMGHVLPGIESTYNRFAFDNEKKIALEKLATLLDGIIHQRENVLPMTKSK